MSPIRLRAETPVYAASEREQIFETDARVGEFLLAGIHYVLPEGAPLSSLVEVRGFQDDPGGMIVTPRLNVGQGSITLTTSNDLLFGETCGVQAIEIDGVAYRAVGVEECPPTNGNGHY